jgi:chemotaxis signal transduction protein
VTSPDDLISHMRGVQAAERDLRDLGVVWQMIESSAAISCPEEVAPILPTLVNTRRRFDDLRGRLVSQMALENQAELADELGSKAQCAIDILVRNLYERTADVGFLATDESIRTFCATAASDKAEVAAMVARLAEYQAKYTVYDDVILLAPDGTVLARLDEQPGPARSTDPVLAAALAAPSYVERFGSSDLAADGAPTLWYAHRIAAGAGQAERRAVGVLVLRFRFADEMQRIFESINEDNPQLALMLVDDQQRVVASNDTAHVPTGARMAKVATEGIELSAFAGREYLAVCRVGTPYQGYRGPAWRAQAMVSLLTAFRQRDVDPTGEQVPLENPALVAMNRSADSINIELRRVVWNGRLMAGEQSGDRARLKAVLQQVNHAGLRTRDRVGMAIQDIYRTSLARARRHARELARLAADILDRNLYERANDCRWWALSPVLREQLAAEQPDTAAMADVLNHIHSLYTVYNRLVVFDAEGRVRAATGEYDSLLDTPVPDHWLQAVGAGGNSQRYAVSPFEDTTFHDQGPTYVYLAAVRHPTETGRSVGGIAIVFNAAAELSAMLRDVLGDRTGLAAFVDADGRVLAATDSAAAAAVTSAMVGAESLHEHDGANWACALTLAGGYREYKTTDGHSNGVRALVGLRLGPSERRRQQLSRLELSGRPRRVGQATMEIAVFQVGANRYALPSAEVLSALSIDGEVRTSALGPALIGLVEVKVGTSPGPGDLVPVVCMRRLLGVNYPARETDGVLLALPVPGEPERPLCALRVDEVLTVLEMPLERLHPAPAGFARFAPWVDRIVECLADDEGNAVMTLLQLLNSQRLIADVLPGGANGQEALDSFSEAADFAA